jgi:hypothetical protein
VTRLRWLILGAAVVAVVGAVLMASDNRDLPARTPPPPPGAAAEVGVAYGVVVYCDIPIELGGLWWAFPAGPHAWPADNRAPWPLSIWETISSPYEVTGIVTLVSPTEAVFRADSDGTALSLSGHEENPTPGLACL